MDILKIIGILLLGGMCLMLIWWAFVFIVILLPLIVGLGALIVFWVQGHSNIGVVVFILSCIFYSTLWNRFLDYIEIHKWPM